MHSPESCQDRLELLRASFDAIFCCYLLELFRCVLVWTNQSYGFAEFMPDDPHRLH